MAITFSDQTPANGSTLFVSPPTVSVRMVGSANLPAGSMMSMYINSSSTGSVTNKTLTLDAGNAKAGVLSGNPNAPLPIGIHTVTVTFKDGLNTVTNSWSFTIAESPVIPDDRLKVTNSLATFEVFATDKTGTYAVKVAQPE